ncbi:VRR-NUC domain-containing protein [Crassisporium funariophilum]|nr:VRR-NUC domain-containing protein [Crassisporium funariophilum]
MAGAGQQSLIQQLIFGGTSTNQESIEQDLEKLDEQRRHEGSNNRPSAYVEVFETTVRTVIEHEHELLCEQEINVLEYFSKLCYNTRYCLTRLVLRKANQWHPVSALEKYKQEVGEDGLLVSIGDLCRPIDLSIIEQGETQETLIQGPKDYVVDLKPGVLVKKEEEDCPDIIDLTGDSDDEDMKPRLPQVSNLWANNADAGPSQLAMSPVYEDPVETVLRSDPTEMNLGYFCEDESQMTLQEILGRLNKDQLVELAKATKCKIEKFKSKKSDIIHALQGHARQQTILPFESVSSRKGKGRCLDDGLYQSKLSFSPIGRASPSGKPKTCQLERLKVMALKLLGKCIRVNFDFYRLVRRLHIICYRETEHPTALLLPALLTTFKKRNYTTYDHIRDKYIWISRQDLLEYEKALELEKVLDQIMEESDDKNSRRATQTPGRARDTSITSAMTPGLGRSCTTPKTPGPSREHRIALRTPSIDVIKTEILMEVDETTPKLEFLDDKGEVEDDEKPIVSKERVLLNHLQDWILPRWKEHIKCREAQAFTFRSPGLERFETGHVYTRMVHKAAKAFGPLKDYESELEVIESLLAQRCWRRGKRARWYERRAIVLGHLIRDSGGNEEKQQQLRLRNLDGVKAALLDEDTALVWRPSLVRRLRALEKKLRVPADDRCRSDGKLRTAEVVVLPATRVYPVIEKENATAGGLHPFISITKNDSSDKSPPEPKSTKKGGGKSSWKGRNDQVVNVETRALEHYEDQGFKGFHSETRILTTIFGLLFWDIIFTSVPGAFETPFQSAPLDINEDSFYYARKKLIDARITEIVDGRGLEILQRHDDLYREKGTWCIGVNWDLCSREDLLEIVECLGGESIAMICRLFCEDYGGRSSGVPDLIVWSMDCRLCKFVEVKGPGDTPQENQKLWFDSLLGANAAVEICKVVNIADQHSQTSTKKRKRNTPGTASRKKTVIEESHSEEDYDQMDPTPTDGNDLPQVHASSSQPRKRRRVGTVPGNHQLDDLIELPFASAEAVPPLSPTLARRINRN